MRQERDEEQAVEVTASEFEKLIGEPVATRNYIPKMELTARQQRNLKDIRRRLLEEARMMGELAYYGWGAGSDKIEGPSVKLAMAAVRCWGNCSVEAMPLQETRDAYVFTSRFIDLETGYTLERQFRQSKNWTVYGKHDPERKADIRFQIGQSKAARNLVLNALPEWLIDEAMEEAKAGCREKIEAFIAKNGLPAAVDAIMRSLAKEGVKEDAVFSKLSISKRDAIKVDDIVMLKGCLKAIQDGTERAAELFPAMTKPVDDRTLAEKTAEIAADKAKLDGHPLDTPEPPDLKSDWLTKLRAVTDIDQVDIVVRDAMENDGVTIHLEAAEKKAAMLTKQQGRKQTQRPLPGE